MSGGPITFGLWDPECAVVDRHIDGEPTGWRRRPVPDPRATVPRIREGIVAL